MANTIDWVYNGNIASLVGLDFGYTADLGFRVADPVNTPNFTAKIMRGNKQIGRLTWTKAGAILLAEWYGGSSLTLVLAHRDVLSIVRNDTGEKVDLMVIRFNLKDASSPKSLASIIKHLGQYDPGKWMAAIVNMHNKVQAMIPNTPFHGKLNTASMLGDIGRFASGAIELPITSGTIFRNAGEISNSIPGMVPPTPKQIFDSWGRMDGQTFFPGGTQATGSAAAWTWDASIQAAVQPNNAYPTTGFISLDSLDNYELAVTLSSAEADNDDIGVILAASVVGTAIDQLSVYVNRGGDGAPFDQFRNQIIYNAAGTGSKVILTNTATISQIGAWASNFIRVFVKRAGDIFTVRISDWNSMIPNEASKMVVDLNSDPLLAKFKGPKPYGYITYSQAGAYFKDIALAGGLLQDILVNAATGQVWRYMDGAWGVLPGLTVADIYGAPRKIKDTRTGDIYNIAVDGTMSKVV